MDEPQRGFNDYSDEFRDQAILTYNAFAPAVLTRVRPEAMRRSENARLMLLRESLIYRSDAIAWHTSLISRLQRGASAQMESMFGRDPNAPGDIARISAREQQFAFDDVIFNAISLFDYVGNTVAFSLYGEPHQKAKWTRVEHYARDPIFEKKATGGTRISESGLGSTIHRNHVTLYARLMEYRSELLHYHTAPAGGEVSTQLQRNDSGSFDASTKLGITAPEPFSKWCVVPGYKDRPNKLPIELAGAWVCEQTQNGAIAILKELERELRREAGRDPDGTDRLVQML